MVVSDRQKTASGKLGSSVSKCFFYLKNKKMETYTRCWQALKEVAPDFKPEKVHSDMEEGLFRSFEIVFGVTVSFCNYHVIMAWQRRLQKEKLRNLIGENQVLADYWTLLKGLPYSGFDDEETILMAKDILNDEIITLKNKLR